jgi:hypothetical protein
MAFDRGPLVIRYRLAGEPSTTEAPEQVRMRAARDQMGIEDRMHLILDPRAMADHLVAPRHQSAPSFGCRIGRPDLGQIAGRIEAGKRPGVDLVGLYMGVGDRLHLQRIGDHHALHERRQDPRHRHAVAGGLDHHLVGG